MIKNIAEETYKKYIDLDKSRTSQKENIKIKTLQESK